MEYTFLAGVEDTIYILYDGGHNSVGLVWISNTFATQDPFDRIYNIQLLLFAEK